MRPIPADWLHNLHWYQQKCVGTFPVNIKKNCYLYVYEYLYMIEQPKLCLSQIIITQYNVNAFSRLLAIKTDNADLDTDDLVTLTNLLEKIINVNSSSKEVCNTQTNILWELLKLYLTSSVTLSISARRFMISNHINCQFDETEHNNRCLLDILF